jgi:hypothetical protein
LESKSRRVEESKSAARPPIPENPDTVGGVAGNERVDTRHLRPRCMNGQSCPTAGPPRRTPAGR